MTPEPKPLPPDVLAGALQDCAHQSKGRLIESKPVLGCPRHPDAQLLPADDAGVKRWFCAQCQSTVVPEVDAKVLRAKYKRNCQRKLDSSKTSDLASIRRKVDGNRRGKADVVDLSEADVKRTVDALCEFAQNQGRGMYVRLFTGDLLLRDETGRVISRVRGCAPGTPDRLWLAWIDGNGYETVGETAVTWFELKRPKDGHQSPEQIEFQARVEAQGCRYLLVTDVEQVREIIG